MLGIFLFFSSFDCCVLLFGRHLGEPDLWGVLSTHPHHCIRKGAPVELNSVLCWESCFGYVWSMTFSFSSGCIELCNRTVAPSAQILL